MSDELLTVTEIANELKVTRQTVHTWISRGDLPRIQTSPARLSGKTGGKAGAQRRRGGAVRVRRRDLDAFLRARTRAASSPTAPTDVTPAIEAQRRFGESIASLAGIAAAGDPERMIAALRALAQASTDLADTLDRGDSR